ncbi:MAG: DNA-processing protein DprA [Chloroflexota bacterium]|nr:DNA-processing protein DprA [Chloroflexota bacterium]
MSAREQAWLVLCLIDGLGSGVLMRLITHFDGDASAVLRADESTLRAVQGIGAVLASRIRAVDAAEMMQQVAAWRRRGIQLLLSDDQFYPRRLHGLPDAPSVIFVMGSVQTLATFRPLTCAIVGTRTPSAAGMAASARLAETHARMGETIVSGLALGIDAHGHTAALNARGTTAAVLGGSLLNIYPPQNQTLAARILHESSGVLLSETRPDLTVRADRLVARNRLIAALSDTIIVVESNEDGGAMHVARWAHKLDRALYTVDLPASGNQRMIEAGVAVT